MARSLSDVMKDVQQALEMTETSSFPAAIKAANQLMGFPNEGPIPAQVAKLASALGVEPPGGQAGPSAVAAVDGSTAGAPAGALEIIETGAAEAAAAEAAAEAAKAAAAAEAAEAPLTSLPDLQTDHRAPVLGAPLVAPSAPSWDSHIPEGGDAKHSVLPPRSSTLSSSSFSSYSGARGAAARGMMRGESGSISWLPRPNDTRSSLNTSSFPSMREKDDISPGPFSRSRSTQSDAGTSRWKAAKKEGGGSSKGSTKGLAAAASAPALGGVPNKHWLAAKDALLKEREAKQQGPTLRAMSLADLRDAALARSMLKQRLDVHTSYETRLAQKVLQSQEIDLELQAARRRLRAARKKFLPREALKKLERTLDSIKVSLEDKEVLVNTKLNKLEKEIAQIVLEIDDIRIFRKMHAEACRQSEVDEQAVDVSVHSMARQMKGAFNERDKLVNELKILQRQEKGERAKFVEQMRLLKKEGAAHETDIQLLLTELEAREEDYKRRDYIEFRGVRGKHEALVTRYGYLCTQRERIAAAYAELNRRMGAGEEGMPADISVLQQPGYMPRDITERFATLEATVTSLLNLQEVHRNQMEEIQLEIDALAAEADEVERGHAAAEAEREAEEVVAAGQARTYARATRTAARDAEVFARICRGVQEVAASAECRLPPALKISGCSQANLEQYLGALHQRLDDIELVGIESSTKGAAERALAREADAGTAADAAPPEPPVGAGADTAE